MLQAGLSILCVTRVSEPARIPLRSVKYPGLFALMDEDDRELVAPYTWWPHWNPCTDSFYALTQIHVGDKWPTLRMHRLIAGVTAELVVDHKNHNTLDNRRENLRPATQSQNMGNMRKKAGTSKYKGVFWFKSGRKWRAMIQVGGRRGGKQAHLGLFDSEEEAARAYDEAALKVFGDFAMVNNL